jgi:2'-5' RNA ligase
VTLIDQRERRLVEIYDDVWAEGRRALIDGRLVAEPLPVVGTVRWGISAVLRPRSWSPALRSCATRCAELMGDGGVVYDAENLHITVRALEGYREQVTDEADAYLRIYDEVLTEVSARWMPIGMRLRGLASSPSGVLIQGWPMVDLQGLRAELHRRLAAQALPVTGPEQVVSNIRTTAHATLSIYGTVDHPRDLASFIDANRTTDFGEQTFDRLWLVGYRRTAREVELIPYRSFVLSGTKC